MPSSRLIGIGAFVLGGVLLFAVALFMIGERRMLFQPKFTVFTEFAALSGLEGGAEVRVAGMAAGEVEGIQVPASPSQKFRVRLVIREDLHPLVRTDSVASIRTEGLVGGQFLLVSIGSAGAPRVAEGATIPSREPFDLADVLQQFSTTVTNINETITGLRSQIEGTIAVISKTGEDADAVVTAVGQDVREITQAGTRVAADTQAILSSLRAGNGTIGKLLTDDEIYQRALQVAADAEAAVTNVREASEQVHRILAGLGGREGAAAGLATDLRDTLDRAREVLTNLSEDSEALKRNWFFSGYFKRRGYYSLASISPAEYRQGVLEQDGQRLPLRIWLGADVLFLPGGGESPVLTDGGRARIDSAMSTFLEYQGSAPIVVEGYAQEGGLAERFIVSRARAVVVRDYLLDRFHLAAERVGTMPLGAEASGSPSGSTWNGVAITMFVEKAALGRPDKDAPAGR